MFSKFAGYERFMGRWSRLLAPKLVEFAGVRAGDAVLDVGTGTGSLAHAVREVTAAGAVTGIDPSADYVAAAERLSDARTRFEVGDSQALRFDSAAFDTTLSLLVLNFIPDRVKALSEMVRVTRPGGVVAAAVWDYAGEMQMLRVFWNAVLELDPASAERDEAHMPLCRSGELVAFWRAQGLHDVTGAALTIGLRFASFDDYWAPFLLGQGPAGAYVSALSKEQQAALEGRLRERLLGRASDRPIELEARAWAAKGVVRAAT